MFLSLLVNGNVYSSIFFIHTVVLNIFLLFIEQNQAIDFFKSNVTQLKVVFGATQSVIIIYLFSKCIVVYIMSCSASFTDKGKFCS